VIAHNQDRRPKDLWTSHGDGDRIVRYYAEDEYDEASFVASSISKLHETDARPWREMAVFYRANAQSRVLEDAFMRHGIPYKVVGGTKFYDRREVKDALAYLNVAVNPHNEVSVKRVINIPKRGIGDTSIGKIDAYAKQHAVSFFEALQHASEAGVSGAAVKGITSFVSLINEVHDSLSDGPASVLQVVTGKQWIHHRS
jgi:DNA helicase II / ATP-dependent DNA helicase PcrA